MCGPPGQGGWGLRGVRRGPSRGHGDSGSDQGEGTPMLQEVTGLFLFLNEIIY